MGEFIWVNIRKSGKCHELYRKLINNLTPTHPGVAGFRGQHFKSQGNVMNCRENRYIFVLPHPTHAQLVEGGRGKNVKVTKHIVLKSISECNYPERLHCKYPG